MKCAKSYLKNRFTDGFFKRLYFRPLDFFIETCLAENLIFSNASETLINSSGDKTNIPLDKNSKRKVQTFAQ